MTLTFDEPVKFTGSVGDTADLYLHISQTDTNNSRQKLLLRPPGQPEHPGFQAPSTFDQPRHRRGVPRLELPGRHDRGRQQVPLLDRQRDLGRGPAVVRPALDELPGGRAQHGPHGRRLRPHLGRAQPAGDARRRCGRLLRGHESATRRAELPLRGRQRQHRPRRIGRQARLRGARRAHDPVADEPRHHRPGRQRLRPHRGHADEGQTRGQRDPPRDRGCAQGHGEPGHRGDGRQRPVPHRGGLFRDGEPDAAGTAGQRPDGAARRAVREHDGPQHVEAREQSGLCGLPAGGGVHEQLGHPDGGRGRRGRDRGRAGREPLGRQPQLRLGADRRDRGGADADGCEQQEAAFRGAGPRPGPDLQVPPDGDRQGHGLAVEPAADHRGG